MRQLQHTKEVLDSWRKCMDEGLPNSTASPLCCIEGKALEARRMEHSFLISVFDECIEIIGDLISENYLFLLVDSQGILLKKNKLT